MKKWILFVALLGVVACRKDRNEPVNAALVGEWHYVGTYSHLADYACMPCPGYNYDKAPTLNIDTWGKLSGKSVVNQYGGTYRATMEDSTRQIFQRGTFRISMLFQTEMAGTPAQMQEERQYVDRLQKTINYYVGNTGPLYVSLSLSQAKSTDYLFFVRKK